MTKTDKLTTFLEITAALHHPDNPEHILVDTHGNYWQPEEFDGDSEWHYHRPLRLPTPAERAKYLLEKGHVITWGCARSHYNRSEDGRVFVKYTEEKNANWKLLSLNLEEFLLSARFDESLQDLGPYVEPKPERVLEPAPRVLTPDNFKAEIDKLRCVEVWQGNKRLEKFTHPEHFWQRVAIHYVVHHGEELGQELRNYKWKEGA